MLSLAEWEAELQKELTDYEVVGGASAVDDAALEKEIMDEMNKSGEDLKWLDERKLRALCVDDGYR